MTTTANCACKPEFTDYGNRKSRPVLTGRTKYCPLHAAAEDMRVALGLYVLAVGNTGAIVDPTSARQAYERARAALAKAEGKA